MRLLDVINAPWAIEPAKLLEIQGIYATHLRGDKIDIAGVESRLGRPLDNAPKPYEVQDGVAIIALEGVMAKRANLFSQISGGVSTQLVGRDLQTALDDSAVHSIILAIDSPGGTVDGTQTLADLIAASSKPVVAWASGSMCSAAYWAGSAASKIYIADGTTHVGSIGIVATHTDVSGAEAAKGIKTSEIYAGAYKRIASSYEPLTQAGRQSIQDQVDYTYGLFVDAVAKQRRVSADTVLKNMADGRIFMGQQAVDAGLVDGVSTLSALVQQLNDSRSSAPRAARGALPRAGVAQTTPTPPLGTTAMLTAEQLAAEHPALAAHFIAQGATAERERIQSVEAAGLPGHEALINTLKFDGKSTAGDAALAIVHAERQGRQAAAAANAGDAPQPVAAAPVATVVPTGAAAPLTRQQLDAAAKEHMAANPGVDYISAVKHVQKQGA